MLENIDIEKGKNKLVYKSLSPPWLLSELVPIPDGPIPLPMPPNTPPVEGFPMVGVVVLVPVVLFMKMNQKSNNYQPHPNAKKCI